MEKMFGKFLVLHAENASSQSDCKIHKLVISQEQFGQSVWFFSCWMVKGSMKICNTLDQSFCRILKAKNINKDEGSQSDILHVDRDLGKFNCDLTNFGKVGSWML